MTGIWSGTIKATGQKISGKSAVTIDADGLVRGVFVGDFGGNVAGKVDLYGNLAATGTATDGTDVTEWQGKLSVSGKSLSSKGTLSSPAITGDFSGTGTTSSASVYQGSLNCSWAGQRPNGTPFNGTFTLIIDKNGNVSGAVTGSYTGTISGVVDIDGTLVAVGTSSGSTTLGSTWSAKIAISGKSLAIQGDWTSKAGSGTFFGTGTTTN
jgi:hypothetical protein